MSRTGLEEGTSIIALDLYHWEIVIELIAVLSFNLYFFTFSSEIYQDPLRLMLFNPVCTKYIMHAFVFSGIAVMKSLWILWYGFCLENLCWIFMITALFLITYIQSSKKIMRFFFEVLLECNFRINSSQKKVTGLKFIRSCEETMKKNDFP